jgi:hypothetical protein
MYVTLYYVTLYSTLCGMVVMEWLSLRYVQNVQNLCGVVALEWLPFQLQKRE